MNSKRALVPVAALILAACGGGGEETEGGAGAGPDSVGPAATGTEAPVPTTPGTVDTAGVGANPPTAGGQLVDSAAVPGPTDTAQGTPTAP